MAHTAFVLFGFFVLLLTPCIVAYPIDLDEEERWLEEHRVISD